MTNSFKEVKYSLTKKLFIGLLIIGIIVGGILAFVSYFYNKEYILEITSGLTNSCAVDVANMMYNIPVDKFLKGEEKTLYNNHLRSMRNIASTFGLKYLYVYVPDTVNNRLIAIIGVEGETGNIIKDFELGNSPKNLKLNDKVMDMFFNKRKNLTIQIDNEYGHVLSGYATILDDKSNPIAIAGADVDFGLLMSNLKRNAIQTFLYLMVVLVFILIVVMQYIKNTFIKPILRLSVEMQNAIEDNQSQFKPIDIKTNDEFNAIAGLYNIVSKEKKRMDGELLFARTIQLSSLPSKFPPYPDVKEFDIYANTLPAKEVGGDFYDFFFINEDKFMFLIADVSGKGIPAALFMMTTKTLIKSIASENIPYKEMIKKINKQICANNEQGFFVTMYATIVDIKTGLTTLINCGHNPPLIKRNNKFEYLNIEPNIVLGAVDDCEFDVSEITLNIGDTLFLYTDGVSECLNENEELYGENRLIEELNSDNYVGCTPQKLVENLFQTLKTYAGNAEQSDDITMVTFEYKGNNITEV